MRSAVLVLCLLSLGAGAQEHWRRLNGPAIKALFAGNEFGDGVHFAYRFERNGTFTGTAMARDVAGNWRVANQQFCWKWREPRDPEECYEVQRDGGDVRLLVNGSEAWYGRVRPK